MIRHIVLIKFRDDVSEEHRQEIYAELRGLVGKIDGLIIATFGPNVSPEGLSKGFRDGFIMDLRDAESRDRGSGGTTARQRRNSRARRGVSRRVRWV